MVKNNMVKNIILMLTVLLFLNGCFGNKKVIYQDVITPINIVPEPPTIQVPLLEVNTLTEEEKENDGELLKAYKITTYQLLDFSKILLSIYDEYMSLSKESKTLYDILEKYNTNSGDVPMSSSVDGSTKPDVILDAIIAVDAKFNFTQDFKLWKTQNKFKELQKTINKLESTNYVREE